MSRDRAITRREALRRLGLAAAAAYVAPTVAGLSTARASSAPTPPSAPSEPSPPSAPSGASPRSGARASSSGARSVSGPSSAGSCRLPTDSSRISISQRDYARAQEAISQGRAKPLREVLEKVVETKPGRPVRVGFAESSTGPQYRILLVGPSGQVLSLTVDARTGVILSAGTC